MNMYNLANTWFVSRLGTDALAAISFTFPVVMLLMFLTRGLGSGALTLVAHAIGGNDRARAATLTTHAIILAVLFAVVVSVLGLLTIEPLFMQLGASGETLRLVDSYMRIWYLGAVVMVLQIVTIDIIVSTGSTKVVSALMVGSTLLNVLLDMGLIFGRFGMPQMGIVGAALATLISQLAALLVAFYILAGKMRLIDTGSLKVEALFQSFKQIMRFGIPGALGMILTPISAAVIIKMVAAYGNPAVAAMGVASRIEMFAFMIPMSVGMSLIPFVAQNFGGGRLDRIRQARRFSMSFAVLYGVFIGLMFFVFAERMASLFSTEQAVIDVLCSFVYITCMGYGMLEVHRYAGFMITGAHYPLQASLLNIIRVAVLLIPLAVVSGHLFGLHGIFWSRLATDLICGMIGIWWSGRMLTRAEQTSKRACLNS